MFKSVHTKDYSNPLRNVYSTVILPPPSSSSLSPSPSSQTNTTTNLNLTPSTSILSTSSSSSSSSTTTTTTTQTDSLLNLSPGLTANLTSQDPLSHQTHSLHQFHLQSSELIMPNHQHSPTSKLMRPPQRPPACRMCKRRKSKCDFELPCSTCMLHNTVDSCAYDKLAIPRERKQNNHNRPPTGAASLSNRGSELKLLKTRLSEAQKRIDEQAVTIQAQQASLDILERRNKLNESRNYSDRIRSKTEPSTVHHLHLNPSQTLDPQAQSETSSPSTLADEITRLVIGTAISPSNNPSTLQPSPNSPPSPPLLPTSTSITHPTRLIEKPELECQSLPQARPQAPDHLNHHSGLRADVLRLLFTHSSFSYLARRIGIGGCVVGSGWLGSIGGGLAGSMEPTHASTIPSSSTRDNLREGHHYLTYPTNLEPNPSPAPPLASSSTYHPPTTILPTRITIQGPNDLVALFPPRKEQALRLLNAYLGFVNLVHCLVDGEQARVELEWFYELYGSDHLTLSDPPPTKPLAPMPISDLMDLGWLSGMLAIFILGSNPEDRVEFGNGQTIQTVWLQNALQGLAVRFGDTDGLARRPVDITALRCACLVVWIFVLHGKDEDILPAINFNSVALYRACDQLQLHRDPTKVLPGISPRVAEDHRRVFYNLINTDWLFSAIIGKTYSPVSLDGHDVRIPTPIQARDQMPEAIEALGFRSLLMRQLRKLATMWIGSGMICVDQALAFEDELDRLDSELPEWCEIKVDPFDANKYDHHPQAQALFSQQIITNVQRCAVRVRFHSKLAAPSAHAPQWIQDSAPHHRKLCIEAGIRLLKLERVHRQHTVRVLGHSGYPRFHPIVGGLTLSALMAKSRHQDERRQLFHELSSFTKFIKDYGSLSQVTNLGIEAIETALTQVVEEERMAAEASQHQFTYDRASLSSLKNVAPGTFTGLCHPESHVVENQNEPLLDHQSQQPSKLDDQSCSSISNKEWAHESRDQTDSVPTMRLGQVSQPISHQTPTSLLPRLHYPQEPKGDEGCRINPSSSDALSGQTQKLRDEVELYGQGSTSSDPTISTTSRPWLPSSSRESGARQDSRECNPISTIDEFLSTFIARPSSVNGIITGQGEPGQFGGERTGGGGLGWGIAQDRYYGLDGLQDLRALPSETFLVDFKNFESNLIGGSMGATEPILEGGLGSVDGHPSNRVSSSRVGRSGPMSISTISSKDRNSSTGQACSSFTIDPLMVTHANSVNSTQGSRPDPLGTNLNQMGLDPPSFDRQRPELGLSGFQAPFSAPSTISGFEASGSNPFRLNHPRDESQGCKSLLNLKALSRSSDSTFHLHQIHGFDEEGLMRYGNEAQSMNSFLGFSTSLSPSQIASASSSTTAFSLRSSSLSNAPLDWKPDW